MVKYSLLFLVLLVTTTYAQIGPDGTGTANGYSIGPGANLSGADLTFTNLTGANLSGAQLSDADFENAILYEADLSGAVLTNANLNFSNLISANFNGADLTGAILSFAVLTNANLSFANLNEADLSFAMLNGADLSGANLRNTQLQKMYDTDIIFREVIFTNVISQSDYDAVVAERDAALAAQASAEAERDAKFTLDEVKDLRAGSTMIEIDNGQATLSMEVEESDDLAIWTSGGTTNLTVPADMDIKYFRFKMTE